MNGLTSMVNVMKKAVFALFLTLVASPALATDMETMICKNGIVSKGNIDAEVLAKCGEPALKSQREEKRFGRVKDAPGRESTTVSILMVNDWTYNFGPNEFMQRLVFENGILVRIESLSYGY